MSKRNWTAFSILIVYLFHDLFCIAVKKNCLYKQSPGYLISLDQKASNVNKIGSCECCSWYVICHLNNVRKQALIQLKNLFENSTRNTTQKNLSFLNTQTLCFIYFLRSKIWNCNWSTWYNIYEKIYNKAKNALTYKTALSK